MITEVTSDSDSDPHSPQYNVTAPQCDTHTDDITGTNCTQWTDSTHYQASVPLVHRFRQSSIRIQQKEAPHITKTLTHSVFSCSSFLKLCNCWWKRQKDISPESGHAGQRPVTTAQCDH